MGVVPGGMAAPLLLLSCVRNGRLIWAILLSVVFGAVPVAAQENAPAALPAPDAPAAKDPRLHPLPETVASDDVATNGTPLTIGIATGYSLRLQEDERVHGAIGRFSVDVPLLWGFGVRGEINANAWGPAPAAPRPLVLSYGGLSLIYAVDEGPIRGILGVGAAAGVGVDVVDGAHPEAAIISANNGLYAGALLSVGIRVRIGPTTHVELTGLLPVMVQEPTGVFLRAPFGTDRGGLFPFQPSVAVGLVFEPVAFTRGILRGEPVWSLVAPTALETLSELFTL